MTAVSGEAVFERVEQLRQLISELEPILQSLMLNDSTIIDGLAQLLASLQQMQRRTEARLEALASEMQMMNVEITRLQMPSTEPAGHIDFDKEDPELSLLQDLLPFLPSPVLIDVGANVGHVAERLAAAGYEVFAFEPFPESFAALSERSRAMPDRLHAFACAIGASDGETQLLIAQDLEGGKWNASLFHSTVRHPMLSDLAFGSQARVKLRSLASLVGEGILPATAAVLKVDTEGADLEVIRGAGDLRFDIVVLEFWDEQHPFGREGHGALSAQVEAMRHLGYRWHVVIYRLDEQGSQGYFFNMRAAPRGAWGNVLYFRDFSVFSRAARWCFSAFG
jgi:FkbM family methyltransferase